MKKKKKKERKKEEDEKQELEFAEGFRRIKNPIEFNNINKLYTKARFNAFTFVFSGT